MSEMARIIDRFQKLRADRQPKAQSFLNGERPYMIFQTPPSNISGDIRTKEQSFNENILNIKASLDVPSDHIPVMEPWFGTGAYANMYGCDYVIRDGNPPAVHYKYHFIEEIRNLPKPDWSNGDVAHLILEAIRYFKSKSGDALPIVRTDTQSAADTATLILDASETFIGCITEPETIMDFMRNINKLIIEFSQVQEELIGDAMISPGHIMLNQYGFGGMSVSDDNLAVASPEINAEFNLLLDEEIGKAMGGVAIHSCGNWSTTMPLVKKLAPSCVAIDCALDTDYDPTPNPPEAVREAFKGTGIHVHVRMTGETERMLETVKHVLHPDLKIIVHPKYIDLPTAEKNYFMLDKLLGEFYNARRKS